MAPPLFVRVDWNETLEAHVFKADIPGLKKDGVKVELEDNKVLQAERGTWKRRTKKTSGTKWRGAATSFCGGFSFQRM